MELTFADRRMARLSRSRLQQLANARAALADRREARRPLDPVLVRLLNPNRWRHIHNRIISYLNETEFAALLQVPNRRLRKNLLNQPPPRKQVCEALKPRPLGSRNQLLHGQRTTCWITSQYFPPPSLRQCEGSQLGLNYDDMHNSTFEICAECSIDALMMYQPAMRVQVSPLCRTCSLADADAQRFPGSWTCRCLSPSSSRALNARLCYRCREALCDRMKAMIVPNMQAKLPVLTPQIPAILGDERRWRTRSVLLGGWLTGCRECRITGAPLVRSYYENPINFFGPALPPDDPRYENWRDPVWQFHAMRCMVFKCLECDGNVGWYSVALAHLFANS